MTTKATTSLQSGTPAQHNQDFFLRSKSGVQQCFSKVALSPKGRIKRVSHLFSRNGNGRVIFEKPFLEYCTIMYLEHSRGTQKCVFCFAKLYEIAEPRKIASKSNPATHIYLETYLRPAHIGP